MWSRPRVEYLLQTPIAISDWQVTTPEFYRCDIHDEAGMSGGCHPPPEHTVPPVAEHVRPLRQQVIGKRAEKMVAGLLIRVGPEPASAVRHPHERSGDQLLGVRIARAPVLGPEC